MTSIAGLDVKSLLETSPEALKLGEKGKKFLEAPHKDVFMIPFLVGRNKLNFYGYPLVMADNSELIKSSLDPLAASKPPYELVTNAIVLERPMTLMWLWMHGYGGNLMLNPGLKLDEFLHLYRLGNYFGISDIKGFTNDIALLVAASFYTTPKEDIQKIIADAKNRETLVRLINYFFANISKPSFDFLLTEAERLQRRIDISAGKSTTIINPQQVVLMKLYTEFPELAREINYIPVLINDKYATYAERKALANQDNFTKSNPRYSREVGKIDMSSGLMKYVESNEFTEVSYTGPSSRLKLETWGPDIIKFTQGAGFLAWLNPILAQV